MGDTKDNLKAILESFTTTPPEKCPKCGGNAPYIGPMGTIKWYQCEVCEYYFD